MVKKAVNAKVKLALQFYFSTKEIDQNYFQGNRPANSTVDKSRGSVMKDPWTKEPKVGDTETPLDLQHFEFSKKARKEKKKE